MNIVLLTVFRIAIAIVATVGVVSVWIYQPDTIVEILDFNLSAIKFVAAHTPAPYGAMGESALRGLGAEKALLFAEATFLLRAVLILLTGRAI